MRYHDVIQPRTIREAFSARRVDELKTLAKLLGGEATRKGELVDLLAKALEDPDQARSLYEGLDDMGRKFLQEATHDSSGLLNRFTLQAKYGQTPDFGGSGRGYGERERPPTILRLFFPDEKVLARDLQSMLRGFVPEPPALTVEAHDEPPSKPARRGKKSRLPPGETSPVEADIDVHLRRTSRGALHDVKAILRLVDAGEVKVGEKSGRPSAGGLTSIAGVLAEGDFYSGAVPNKNDWYDPVDLQIQPFAWAMLVQAARLAEADGTRLRLTTAGRKATTMPAHELIRQIWEKWRKTTLLDEFSRIDVIKGQKSKARVLTPIADRRQTVVEALRACPTHKWIVIDEFFRFIKVLAPDFQVANDDWQLYLCEQRYGSFGYDGASSWELLQGRYVLAFLFEYAATLGLLDVAYVEPQGARSDFCDRWGADDLSCLSRYDGLLSFRINALGAWCLDLTESYEPEVVAPEPCLKVLPNLDVVSVDRTIAPADALLLDRFAERKSEALWQLSAPRILEAVEKGLTVLELRSFLEARNQGPLPQTASVFLDDLAKKAGQLADLGAARVISCGDADLARLLVNDRRLRNLCQLAGERQLVFRAADEPAVRRALKELGYVLPPPG